MSGRLLISLILIAGCFLDAEIIRFSKLEKLKAEKKSFHFKKDLFSHQLPLALKFLSSEEQKSIENHLEQKGPEDDPQKELLESVSFEGFIESGEKILALISVSGEFFVVSEGDVILEQFKIIRIDKEKITLELDTQQIEIRLKGEGHD